MRCKRECTGRAFDCEKHLAARKAPRTTIGETTCRCERHAHAQTRGVRHSWLGKQIHCPMRSGLPTAITSSPAVFLPLLVSPPLPMYYQRSAYRFLCITSGLPTATQRSAYRYRSQGFRYMIRKHSAVCGCNPDPPFFTAPRCALMHGRGQVCKIPQVVRRH